MANCLFLCTFRWVVNCRYLPIIDCPAGLPAGEMRHNALKCHTKQCFAGARPPLL